MSAATNELKVKPKKDPALQIDATRERLEQLGLPHAAECLAETLAAAVKSNHSPHVVVDRLLSRELETREERRVRTSLRLSSLPPGMTLDSFDFGFQPSIDRRQVETLATCQFIRDRATLLIQGPPGTVT